MSKKTKNTSFEYSSGNVFADLELPDSDNLIVRAKLGHAVRTVLKERKLKQFEITELLGVTQPEVSRLMNCKYFLFSENRLIQFLEKLEKKITIYIASRQEGEPFQEVYLVQ